MANRIQTGPLNHVLLTVSDPIRSRDFYVRLLGFRVEAEFDIGPMLNNGTTRLILFPAPNQALPDDRFDENRIGLQALAFGLEDLHDLTKAERVLDEHQVPHGLIEDYGPDMGLYSLKLRDPDGIRIELLAPYGPEHTASS